METALVVMHVGAGFTALVVAPVAMLTRKGSGVHKRWGRVYFWAMLAIFVTALLLLLYRPNVFLTFISVLSFYSALTGVRALKRKNPAQGQGAGTLDWGAAAVALAAGVGFILWGGLTFAGLAGLGQTEIPVAFAVLGIVFGVVLGKDAWSDLVSFRRPNEDPLWWWTYHLERMVGSYLAAVTAFLVQNVGPLLPEAFVWVAWVAPGILGGFGITLWIRYYQKRFAARKAPLSAVQS
jgi:hypothetical protein